MLRMLNNASITLVASVLMFSIVGHCEMSIYPGLRRKPLQQLQPPYEINTDFLAQLMEGNARRRLQQQFEQQLELINLQIQRQRERQERLRERYRQQQKLEAMAAAAAAAAENRRHMQDLEEEYLRNYNNEYNDNNNNNNNDNLLLSNDNNISYGNEKYNDGNDDDDDDDEDEDEKKEDDEGYDNTSPDFSYKIPQPDKTQLNHRIQFAVGPSDPRFYEPDSEEDDADDDDDDQLEDDGNSRLQNTDNSYKASEIANADIDANVLDEYEEYKAGDVVVKGAPDTLIPNAPLPLTGEQTSVAANFHRIKPQKAANVAAAGLGVNQLNNDALPVQHDLNTLIDKLNQNLVQTKNNNNNNNNKDELNMVVKEPIGIKTEMGMYMVALVAGITAAVIVGLFIVAIAWYTFHRRNKAAADVDYPAYGITGPNKDISPSGDRKLAQSAQMYHYQHQKQQIMALENRSNVEENGDAVESDDDNEEGDYTVYECPGLAPTAEMEVKNPLFLDDTPVTSLGSQAITQVTTQQPPVKKFINKSSTMNNNASVSSSEQKKSKKSKNLYTGLGSRNSFSSE